MATLVGTKGQVVIEKEIRDALGVEPGSRAIQERVGDRVEIRFLPPEHDRSLRGVLAPFVRGSLPDKPWPELKEEAWRRALEAEAAEEEASTTEGRRP
ncbi:MAG TPA: AbrB/MazE/SpoVT family DNA-binding domain-containing protein [Thermoanaerobaculia bacterium]|nr:AbrB/MazE/SpoVT family DNA-binding domain-containing protein [Thermoanaerobaculia bacterium]